MQASLTTQARPVSTTRLRVVTAERIALALILVLAVLLRFQGNNWDDGHYLHPDERFIVMVTTGTQWPGLGSFFDTASSTLNPANVEFPTYVYGTFPLFLTKLVGTFTGDTTYDTLHRTGRGLSALFDVLTVLIVWAVARRLFGSTAALIGALLQATAVLHIQLSHFYAVDTFATTLCLATFWLALRANDRGKWYDFLFSGVAAGLAIASKVSVLPIVAVVALPALETVRTLGWHALLSAPRPRSARPLVGLVLALLGAAWAFRFTQPYAFQGPSPLSFKLNPDWIENLSYWRRVQSGEIDIPFVDQWADRTPILFVVKNMVLWGLGVPLGIAALIALALGVWNIASGRRWPAMWQVVLVGWPIFLIVYIGVGFVMTMRYVLPAYPFLIILAAGLLASLLERGRHAGGWRRVALALPAAFVVGATVLYAIAFTSIYSRPVTRVAASEWIYQNIPYGSEIRTEHWDDSLPLNLPGFPTDAYVRDELGLYEDDNAQKLIKVVNQLDTSDYVMLTSNRLYESIPRIPARYPMTSVYYDMLFSGELGFELIKTFDSHPTLFGFELNDDGAEEAFTVYDHPKVMIFKKTDAFNKAKVQARLGGALTAADEILNIRPSQASYNLLMMDDAERQTQQVGGTWSAIFDRGSFANAHPQLVWYFALQLLALAAVPLCWRAFPGLADRGYAVAKTLGLLSAAFIAWLLASLKIVSFGREAVLIGICVTLAVSILAAGRHSRSMAFDLRSRWRTILIAEVLFLAAFVFFVWIRSKNPDLWHPSRGGEKPMEFAYFNAVLRSTHFPPYDPWFAGGYINYYYFGYVILAAITRLTGVVPEVAFNLAAPTCFALLVLNTWSFVSNLLSRLASQARTGLRSAWAVPLLGLTGPLFVVMIGNLDLARRIGRGEYGYGDPSGDDIIGLSSAGDVIRGVWRAIFQASPLPSDSFWAPSRVIDDTINEFPYWTFLFSDVHPHLIALPFAAAALVVALGILTAPAWPRSLSTNDDDSEASLFSFDRSALTRLRRIPRGPLVERALLVGIAALVTGALYPLNTWDFPTYVIIITGAFGLLELLRASGTAHPAGAGAPASVIDPIPIPPDHELIFTAAAVESAELADGRRENTPFADSTSASSSPPCHPEAPPRNLSIPNTEPAETAQRAEGIEPTPESSQDFGWSLGWHAVRRTAIWVGATVLLGRLLFFPYFAHYEQPYGGFEVWTGSVTTPGQYLIVHGILLFVVVSFLLSEFVILAPPRWTIPLIRPSGLNWNSTSGEHEQVVGASVTLVRRPLLINPMLLLLAAVAVAVALSLLRDQLPVLLAGLMLLVLGDAWLRRRDPTQLFILGLVAIALGLSATVERYVLMGDIGRMNTVFKLYLQIWMLLGLVAATAVVVLVSRSRRLTSAPAKVAWSLVLLVLVLGGLTFPVMATPARLRDRYVDTPRTLDGTAYMADSVYSDAPDGGTPFSYPLASDLAAFRWLEENVAGSPVVLEGRTPLYRFGSRVSVYTGLPTVLGWDWHQRQQRANYGVLVDRRMEDVDEMLGSDQPFAVIQPLLDKYHVRYIYIGELERGYYDEFALAKFDDAVADGQLSVAYDANGVTIYRYDNAPP